MAFTFSRSGDNLNFVQSSTDMFRAKDYSQWEEENTVSKAIMSKKKTLNLLYFSLLNCILCYLICLRDVLLIKIKLL